MNSIPKQHPGTGMIFKHKDSEFRAMMRDGAPWFDGKNACDILTLTNSRMAIATLDADERVSVNIADGTPGNPNRLYVSESGLYSLILRSRKPEAKEFKRWITHEVLPALRKTGGYVIALENDTAETIAERALLAGQDAIVRLRQMVAERDARLAVTEPKADVFDAHCGRVMTLAEFTKTLHGVNQNMVKQSLYMAGIFFRTSGGYRVYGKHRGVHFEEKANQFKRGQYDIYILPKGKELVTKMYKQERLVMKAGFEVEA